MEMITETSKFEQSIQYRKARKQAREIKGFYVHVATYCVVIPILVAINLAFVPDFYWFPFSMCGWGIGLLFHGMSVYKYTPFLGRNWEDRKIKQFIAEEKAKQDKISLNKNQ